MYLSGQALIVFFEAGLSCLQNGYPPFQLLTGWRWHPGYSLKPRLVTAVNWCEGNWNPCLEMRGRMIARYRTLYGYQDNQDDCDDDNDDVEEMDGDNWSCG